MTAVPAPQRPSLAVSVTEGDRRCGRVGKQCAMLFARLRRAIAFVPPGWDKPDITGAAVTRSVTASQAVTLRQWSRPVVSNGV